MAGFELKYRTNNPLETVAFSWSCPSGMVRVAGRENAIVWLALLTVSVPG